MNFQMLIFNFVSLTLLDVQVNAEYTQEQLECTKAAFVKFFEYLNGVLQDSGKKAFQYTVLINDWTKFDDWSCGILKKFNEKLKTIPNRANLKEGVEAASGTLQLALVNCNVAIYNTSTKNLVDDILSTLGSTNVPMSSSTQNSKNMLHRLFSRAQNED